MVSYQGEGRRNELRRQAFRRLLRITILVALVAAAAGAYFGWPRINVVETGRTPQYPDLKPREYDKSPADITKVARGVADRLGWEYFGGGSGAGGSEIRLKAHLWKLAIPGQVVVHVKGSHGHSTMTIRSESEYGPWDFGQNARNIRVFLAEMAVEME
jgi:hypothetical protein